MVELDPTTTALRGFGAVLTMPNEPLNAPDRDSERSFLELSLSPKRFT